MTDMNQQPGCI